MSDHGNAQGALRFTDWELKAEMEMLGREIDPRPVVCLDCRWVGRRMEARHGYDKLHWDEVVPMDYCPECDSDQLELVEWVNEQVKADFAVEGFQ